MPWYVADFASDEDVMLMSYEQEGVYQRLLGHQWLHGGIPTDLNQIAALVPKVTRQRFLRAIWPAMQGKFTAVDGRLVNAKVERVREAQIAYKKQQSENGRAGASKRWQDDGDPIGETIATDMANVLRMG